MLYSLQGSLASNNDTEFTVYSALNTTLHTSDNLLILF